MEHCGRMSTSEWGMRLKTFCLSMGRGGIHRILGIWFHLYKSHTWQSCAIQYIVRGMCECVNTIFKKVKEGFSRETICKNQERLFLWELALMKECTEAFKSFFCFLSLFMDKWVLILFFFKTFICRYFSVEYIYIYTYIYDSN